MDAPNTEVMKWLFPTLCTLLGITVTAIISWAKDLSARARRLQLLQESKMRIEFWDSYRKSLAELRSLSDRETALIEKEIRRPGNLIFNKFRHYPHFGGLAWSEFLRYRSGQGWIRRVLLFYRQPTLALVRLRLIFYSAVVYAPLLDLAGYLGAHLFGHDYPRFSLILFAPWIDGKMVNFRGWLYGFFCLDALALRIGYEFLENRRVRTEVLKEDQKNKTTGPKFIDTEIEFAERAI